MDRKKKIVLLAGGWSRERDVSLKSGDAVYHALDKDKYDVRMHDPKEDLKTLVEERETIDLAFVLLHGKIGEDGCIQGMLDVLGIPYVGSGVLASGMAFNKRIAKGVFRNCGMQVAKDVVLRRGDDFSPKRIMQILGEATVVKPVAEGSSIGTSVCRTEKELAAGIEKGFSHDQELMVEEYIGGREITCCVLGDAVLETLPLVEIMPHAEYRFFDYEAKYKAGATREVCPADLPRSVSEVAVRCGKNAHRSLMCRVWSRTDMIIKDEDIYLLETNTIPGMTENSLFPLAARAVGMSLADLVEKLVSLSL